MGLRSNNKLWKKNETASLIALYESEHCLYDREHPGFHDIAKQKKAYEKIHEVMLRIRPDCSISEIKNRIGLLQKQYAEELYQKNISNKTESTYKPSMWCFELLQFLDPHLPSRSSAKAVVSLGGGESEKKELDKTNKDISDLRINQQKSFSSENLSYEAIGDYTASNCLEEKTQEENAVKKKRKLNLTCPKALKIFPKKEDPIDREDIFGQYVASEMKSLKENPVLYLQTKQTILEILTSANFELISPD